MKIVTSREFRDNQRKFFDLAKYEKLIVRQGNKHSFLILPITESEEAEMYFSDPHIQAQIQKGIEDVKTGRTTKVTGKEELKKFLDSL